MLSSQEEIEATAHALDTGMTIYQNILHLNRAREKQVTSLLLMP